MLWQMRCHADLIVSLLMLRLCRRPFSDLIRVAYARDEHCVALLRALRARSLQTQTSICRHACVRRLHRYSIDQGLLCYSTDMEDTPRIVAPHDEDLKYRILYEANDTALSGHLGREKTYGSVSQTYWWPNCIHG